MREIASLTKIMTCFIVKNTFNIDRHVILLKNMKLMLHFLMFVYQGNL
jgi:D-alanyl-D-alanine carboxypeptidase